MALVVILPAAMAARAEAALGAAQEEQATLQRNRPHKETMAAVAAQTPAMDRAAAVLAVLVKQTKLVG